MIHLGPIIPIIFNGKGWVACKHGYDRRGENKQARGRENHRGACRVRPFFPRRIRQFCLRCSSCNCADPVLPRDLSGECEATTFPGTSEQRSQRSTIDTWSEWCENYGCTVSKVYLIFLQNIHSRNYLIFTEGALQVSNQCTTVLILILQIRSQWTPRSLTSCYRKKSFHCDP